MSGMVPNVLDRLAKYFIYSEQHLYLYMVSTVFIAKR